MKSTGIVRKVDELGRVVIPKETRDTLQIGVKDPLEIYTDGDMIILKKYQPGCSCCGEVRDLSHHGNIKLCRSCVQTIGGR